MRVFKFGGASVRDAKGIENVASIIRSYSTKKLLVVVSAMGKTTDALEQIVSFSQSGKNITSQIDQLVQYHHETLRALFPDNHAVYNDFKKIIEQLQTEVARKGDWDQIYDQVVSLGEMISSRILSHYLILNGMPVEWIDARQYVRTDDTFREGKINWAETTLTLQPLKAILSQKIILTQGFLGSTLDGLTTTLGREGSDFSAAIFASCLDADSVTIWKDVPGVMNADPKRLSTASVFEELPYKEAAEMTYYGAAIIHPKTIKPLANKGIPLRVRSFVDPALPGTVIHECKVARILPLIVFKGNQCLISCQVTDFSFINEKQIGIVLQTLADFNIKINVMQNSAISFSFCVDYREDKTLKLIDHLGKHFEVFYNTGLTLVTIKNYDAELYQKYHNVSGVLLEQSSRSTLQVLLKS